MRTVEDLTAEVDQLKAALREAVLDRHKVVSRCVESDPAGGTYELTWTNKVVEWAALCDLDLSKYNPFWYKDHYG